MRAASTLVDVPLRRGTGLACANSLGCTLPRAARQAGSSCPRWVLRGLENSERRLAEGVRVESCPSVFAPRGNRSVDWSQVGNVARDEKKKRRPQEGGSRPALQKATRSETGRLETHHSQHPPGWQSERPGTETVRPGSLFSDSKPRSRSENWPRATGARAPLCDSPARGAPRGRPASASSGSGFPGAASQTCAPQG
jgi:hypothetical protein